MGYEMRFVTIGYIEWRKGQDILVDAIGMLPEEMISECSFLLVGQDSSLMAQDLHQRILNKPWVEMTGTVRRDRIHEILDKADVLICPSREDPMPTVCAEAMMHGVPCLVSDATGTAAYIKDGYNGLIFQSENVTELRDKIRWCMEHRNDLCQMGNRAYGIYERVFSEKAFEQSLLKYVEGMIGRADG